MSDSASRVPTDAEIAQLIALAVLADIQFLNCVAASGGVPFCGRSRRDWSPEEENRIPCAMRRVWKGEIAGREAAAALIDELEVFRRGYEALMKRAAGDWIRARHARAVRWNGESWASGWTALFELLETILSSMPQPSDTTDERSYLISLKRFLDRQGTRKLTPLEAAIEQEYAALQRESNQDKEHCRNGLAPPREDKIASALGILHQHPTWTNKEIAAAVGCNEKYLSHSDLFRRIKKTLKAIGLTQLPRGRKDRDGTVEAEDD